MLTPSTSDTIKRSSSGSVSPEAKLLENSYRPFESEYLDDPENMIRAPGTAAESDLLLIYPEIFTLQLSRHPRESIRANIAMNARNECETGYSRIFQKMQPFPVTG